MERGLRSGAWVVAAAWLVWLPALVGVEATWNRAVEISATVSTEAPWRIILSWPEDTEADGDYAPSYVVYRKSSDGEKWLEGIPLPDRQTTFTDTEVEPGRRYEYCVFRDFSRPHASASDHVGYGYIEAGINVPLVHHRGKAIVVVEAGVARELSDKVGRLVADLNGDGWDVATLTAERTATPEDVRAAIRREHEKSAAEALLLLGRIPVAWSGNYAPDGHEARRMPADAFYGDVDGEWSDKDQDGIYDENTIASNIELQVGRIDFAEMGGVGTGKSEMELLGRYLDKNHAFRHAVVRPPRRALVADRIGMDRGRAPAASAYRAFATFFGPENVVRANAEDGGEDDDRFLPRIVKEPYLWAFGAGGGATDAIAFMGTEGDYKSATSSDLAAKAKGTFYLWFGSYFVDWSRPNNLMRAALAAPTYGLTAAWTGRPSLYFHHMALDRTVGYGLRLSQNNDGFYYSPGFPTSWRRHVHVALMGDPTLRLEYVAPVSELSGTPSDAGLKLAWKASPDAERGDVGYYVYRRDTAEAGFRLLNSTPVAEREFTDREPKGGAVYSVRASQVVKTSSGTYENASQAVFWGN